MKTSKVKGENYMAEIEVIELLEKRFNQNKHRHPRIDWQKIYDIISHNKPVLKTLQQMEDTGGEPDVVVLNDKVYYIDMAKETPEKRRNVCFDEQARLARKKFPPESSAEAMARSIGIKLLDVDMYQKVQSIEPLDLKTSSWLATPQKIRTLGGALFGDCRYDHTFIYHNGADSYYGVRGFRGYIELAR